MDKLLTVVIPTYNRKQQLLETLRSFEIQREFDRYKIIISNNCSNYDVGEWVTQNFSKEFIDIINIYNRKYNIGGDLNIASTHQLCQSKWMWLMSDDDIVMPDSLQIVLNDIHEMSEIALIKYSIAGFPPLQDKLCNTFNEVLEAFIAPNVQAGYGQFVFMSNNVINIERVNAYIGEASFYANTSITQLIPSIFAIKKDNSAWRISSKRITNYNDGRSTYANFYIKINFVNIQLIDIDFSEDEIKKIKKMFAGFGGFKNDFKTLVAIKSRSKRRLLFYHFWIGNFSLFSIKGILFFIYYHVKSICK